ncbi:MAG TPA: GntR family transcriptional regulator [Candidatus Limnocylindrales bacterium]|nr:GntR family transcriptional regulator [Candidatus Limnocylindrales bacterium]
MTTAFQFRLDPATGVPVYRQMIDQILVGIATGSLPPGHQLPTVRQVAVDLAINPNTVMRAYRELEIRGVIETQQGTGTFIARQKSKRQDAERERRLAQLAEDFIARGAASGFTLPELLDELETHRAETQKNRR